MAQERGAQAETTPRARERQRGFTQCIELFVVLIAQQDQEPEPYSGAETKRLPVFLKRAVVHTQPNARSQARRYRQSSCALLLRLALALASPCYKAQLLI